MDNALKQVNQEGKRVVADRGKRRTLVQRAERWETELRLQRHWRELAARLDAACEPAEAEDAAREPAVPEFATHAAREAAFTTAAEAAMLPLPEKNLQAEHAPAGFFADDKCQRILRMVHRQPQQPEIRDPARITEREKERACRAESAARQTPARRVYAAAEQGAAWLCRMAGTACAAVARRLARARRRAVHIHHEQVNRRFPESNRLPVQLVLFGWGMLPLLGNTLRERTWGRRKRTINRLWHLRAWIEQKRSHPVAFLSSAGVLVFLVLFFSFYSIGTTVSYNGTVLANVASEDRARQAAGDLETVIHQTLGGTYSLNESLIHYSTGIVPRRDIVDSADFEEELSEEVGLVTYGYSLYVDGEMIGATPYEGALEELLQQLKDAVSDENTISCDFREQVEIRPGYVAQEQIMNLGYLAELLYSTKSEEVTYTVKKGDTWWDIAEDHGLTQDQLLEKNPGYNTNKLSIGEVLTMSAAVPYLTLTVQERECYVADVPYEISYTDSANLYQGDYKVTSEGVYGAADVVANVTYVNGEETQRTILSYVTLVNPVTEQQLRGTKERPSWIATGTFRWPTSGNITSRFGYRTSPGGIGSSNHKGIDIANRRGTAIYAADGGTVVYAGWQSGYGYLVQIDHGNGFVTYYGHNSSLLVRVGQHVYKGQQIAKMGSTGNSTGNHCHFEVRLNGVPKNPMNYLP